MRLRGGAIYIASKAVPSGLGFATTMMLTWLFSPEQLGVYGLGLAAIALGNNVLFDWISVSFQRWYQGRTQDPAFLPTLLALFAALCCLSAALLGLATFAGLLGRFRAEAWLFLLGSCAYGWFEFTSRIQIGRFRPGRYFWMSTVRNSLILVGSVGLAALSHSAELTLAANFAAMFAAGCLYLGDGSIRLRGARFDPALARAFLAYGAPIGLTMILYGLSNSINRPLLEVLASTEDVAAYTVASTLVQSAIGLISTGPGRAGLAAAARELEGGDPHAARAQLARVYTLLLALLVPAASGLVLIEPAITAVLIDPHYHAAIHRMTPWLAAYAVLIGMRAHYIDNAFQLSGRTGLAVQVTAVSAAANLALNVLLVPYWGAAGSAAALAIACAGSVAHAVHLSRRAFPMPAPGSRISSSEAACAPSIASTTWVGAFSLR